MTKYWVDLHGNFLEMFPGLEASPRPVYLASDVDEAIAQAKREVWEEAANDLSHGLPAMWKKALIDRCLFKKSQVTP